MHLFDACVLSMVGKVVNFMLDLGIAADKVDLGLREHAMLFVAELAA